MRRGLPACVDGSVDLMLANGKKGLMFAFNHVAQTKITLFVLDIMSDIFEMQWSGERKTPRI